MRVFGQGLGFRRAEKGEIGQEQSCGPGNTQLQNIASRMDHVIGLHCSSKT